MKVVGWGQRPGEDSDLAPDTDDSATQFAETMVAQRRSILDLESVFGFNPLRDVKQEILGGALTTVNGLYQLTTNANPGGEVVLDSAERPPYRPGTVAEGGFAVYPGTDNTTGNQDVKWGIFDDNDGMYFGEDATGLYVGIRSGGVDYYRVERAAWNIDKLDGTGPSGLTFNPTLGALYRMRFAWYGAGGLLWIVHVRTPSFRIKPVIVHRFKRDNDPAFENPNLILRIHAQNGGTGSSFQTRVGGRSLLRIGDTEDVHTRQTSGRRISTTNNITATPIPFISLRRKAVFAAATAVKITKIEILTNTNVIWELYVNASLVGAAWVPPTNSLAANTTLEMDVTAASFSGGILIASGLAVGGAGSQSVVTPATLPLVDFIDTQPMTLVLSTTGAANGTASAIFTADEEW